MICALGKSTYQVGGMKLIVKGRQASRKEAPILVVAPHSTFLDAGITYVTGFPSIIVRRESGLNPFIGSTYCQRFANTFSTLSYQFLYTEYGITFIFPVSNITIQRMRANYVLYLINLGI